MGHSCVFVKGLRLLTSISLAASMMYLDAVAHVPKTEHYLNQHILFIGLPHVHTCTVQCS